MDSPRPKRDRQDTGRVVPFPAARDLGWRPMIPPEVIRPEVGCVGIAVYVVLAEHAREKGECWPAHSTIAARLKISRGSVVRAIAKLVKLKLVEVEHRRRADGGKSTNVYRLPHVAPADTPCALREHGYVPPADIPCAVVEQQEQDKDEQHEKKNKKSTPLPPTAKVDPLDGFGGWYADYPRKVGRAAAERAWAKLRPDADLRAAMASALAWQRQQPGWTKDGGAYVPHPATWLNGRRWEDEKPPDADGGDETTADAGLAAWNAAGRRNGA